MSVCVCVCVCARYGWRWLGGFPLFTHGRGVQEANTHTHAVVHAHLRCHSHLTAQGREDPTSETHLAVDVLFVPATPLIMSATETHLHIVHKIHRLADTSGSQTIPRRGPPRCHLPAYGPPFEKICQRPSYKRRLLQM